MPTAMTALIEVCSSTLQQVGDGQEVRRQHGEQGDQQAPGPRACRAGARAGPAPPTRLTRPAPARRPAPAPGSRPRRRTRRAIRPSRITSMRSLMPRTSGRSDEIIRMPAPGVGEPVHQLVDLHPRRRRRCRAWARRGSGSARPWPATCRARPSAGCRRSAGPPAARGAGVLMRRSSTHFRGQRGQRAARPARRGGRAGARWAGRGSTARPGRARGPASCGPRAGSRRRGRTVSAGPRAWTSRPWMNTRPDSGRSAPTTARASSVRPAPSRPAMPTTSPRAGSGCTSRRRRPRHRCSTRSSSAPGRRARRGKCSVSSRPAIMRMSSGTVASPASTVPTRRPSRKTVTRCADLRDLLHAVRDVDDADPARGQAAHGREQLADLRLREGRGRLVHDQHARLRGQRLGHLHHLLLGDAQRLHRRARVEAHAQPLEQRARLRHQAAPVHHAAAGRLPAEEDVLGRGELRHEVELLVDGADAELLRVARARDLDRARRRSRSPRRRAWWRRSGS